MFTHGSMSNSRGFSVLHDSGGLYLLARSGLRVAGSSSADAAGELVISVVTDRFNVVCFC